MIRTSKTSLPTSARRAASVLAGLCLLCVSACSSTEVDSSGRWVGGEEIMTSWVEEVVPSDWKRIDLTTTYEDVIDDLGVDTGRDTTMVAATYRGVSKDEFAAFGDGSLEISRALECEPFDASRARPKEKPYVEDCFLDLYQGEKPLPDDFDLFAVWTSFPNGRTVTKLYLENDPG